MSRFKHKILNELLKIYNDRSYVGANYTEEGKSLSTEDMHRKIGLDLDKLNTLLGSLHYNDYIQKCTLHDKTSTFWYIKDKGRDALSENRFLWYCNTDLLLKLGTLFVALIGLLNSIFHFIEK